MRVRLVAFEREILVAEREQIVHRRIELHRRQGTRVARQLQLTRPLRPLPRMRLNPAITDLFAFRYEDFALEGYEPHPHIKAKVAV